VLHPLEFAAVLSAARRHSPTAHALVALLGMLGLRVSEVGGSLERAQVSAHVHPDLTALLRVVQKLLSHRVTWRACLT